MVDEGRHGAAAPGGNDALAEDRQSPAPWVEVVIEIPRGSFLKRGSSGRVDFVSPLPCPYNYGSVPAFLGLEGDLLDALVLGPRRPRGSRLWIPARGAVGLSDRGMYDDKLVCSEARLSEPERRRVLRFFRVYARCKRLLNWLRRQPGLTRCEGWGEAGAAIARASPRNGIWRGPAVRF